MNYNNDEIIPVGYPIVNVSGNGPAMYTDQIVYEDELDKNLTEVIRELKRGGKTYSFKIEGGKLYVSIDGGQTWTLVGDVSGISPEERQAIIDEAEAAAEEAISGALDDIDQAKTDINDLQNIIGEDGVNIVKNSEYDEDKQQIETRIGDAEGNIQSLAQTITGPNGITQRVGQVETGLNTTTTKVSTLEQRAESIDLRVATEEANTNKMSRLLVGEDGIWEGVSSLDASSAELQAARKAMKDDIISQSVVQAKVLKDEYDRFLTKEGYIICVGQTPGQDDIILYCYDEESLPNKYKIKVDGEYVEWTGSAQTINELSDTYPNYLNYVETVTGAFSDISQTATDITLTVADLSDPDKAAQLVLSSDQFKVTADKIELDGNVVASSLNTKGSGDSGCVSIFDDTVAVMDENGKQVVMVSSDSIDVDPQSPYSRTEFYGSTPVHSGVTVFSTLDPSEAGTYVQQTTTFEISNANPQYFGMLSYSGNGRALTLLNDVFAKVYINSSAVVSNVNYSNFTLYYGKKGSSYNYSDTQHIGSITWTNVTSKTLTANSVSSDNRKISDVLQTIVSAGAGDYVFHVVLQSNWTYDAVYEPRNNFPHHYPLKFENQYVWFGLKIQESDPNGYVFNIGKNGFNVGLGNGLSLIVGQDSQKEPYIKMLSEPTNVQPKDDTSKTFDGFILTKNGLYYTFDDYGWTNVGTYAYKIKVNAQNNTLMLDTSDYLEIDTISE